MKKEKNIIALCVLSGAGLVFSGYLSGVKFFTDGCAFNEGCPYFLGYPACYFGFVLFLTLTVLSVRIITSHIEERRGYKWIEVVALLGTFFAGYFTFKEIPTLFSKGLTAYVFGLPTCALGLLFFVALVVVSSRSLSKRRPLVPLQ